MRFFRWLLPVVITAIVAAVAWLYVERRETLANSAPTPPKPLDQGVKSQSLDSCITQSDGEKPRFKACFVKSEQLADTLQLHGVRMEIYHDDGAFDLVEYKTAQFFREAKKLYSDGEVEITLGVPPDAAPSGRLVKIHASGVEFDNESLRIFTDRPVRFEFEQGGGSAVGAFYDPTTRELRMERDVVLDWRGHGEQVTPMHIEAGQAWYFEREARVLLYPWARLQRAGLSMDGGPTEMSLEDGVIRRADVEAARGVQNDPSRRVEFAAEQLHLAFADGMQVSAIQAERDARLISTSATARTTVSGDQLDMAFAPAEESSTLTSAVATGKSRVEIAPVPRPGVQPGDTRILKSDVIRLAMRSGGEEIERLHTDGPGTLEFFPNRPNQPKRSLEGSQIWIDYGTQNRIRQFRSVNATTRTERADRAPMITSSQEILAFFDASGNELTRLEQNTNFRYQEGGRTATANRAILEQATNRVTLDGAARTSDPTGAVTADKILLDQRTNDFTAEGRVTTTREPRREKSSAGMLSSGEVLQASANRMVSTNNGQNIHYEGNAQAWQGANRVQADRLEIDQQRGIMEAHGHVVTQFSDTSQKGSKKTGTKEDAKPVFTVVRASDLTYTESTREALYQGGVTLERLALTVDARTLHAFLTADSTLEKAIADGAVKIVSTELSTAKEKRTRTGTSEHAEYYTAEQKVILTKGNPKVVDSMKGQTTGQELIWWADNDRFVVNGVAEQPARTRFKKK